MLLELQDGEGTGSEVPEGNTVHDLSIPTDGTPPEVRNDPQVVAAYLGSTTL